MICTRRTSDWHGNAFTLSLIGYTFTRDGLYRLFSHVKIKRIDLYEWNKILALCVINIVYVIESAREKKDKKKKINKINKEKKMNT